MSRIHEALKRAQQQKEVANQQEGIVPNATTLDPELGQEFIAEQTMPNVSSGSALDDPMFGARVANLYTRETAVVDPEAYNAAVPRAFEGAGAKDGGNGAGQRVVTTADLENTSMSTLPSHAQSQVLEEIASLPSSRDDSQAAVTPDAASPLTFTTLKDRCCKPMWKPDVDTMLFLDSEQHRIGSEEFRSFRTRLYQLRAKQALKRVLISSPLPSEGKTFVAANLAQVLARQYGRRVLLIDCDLRLSNAHRPLGAPATPGMTEYLRGAADLFSIVQMGPMENLFFIPGGAVASNAAELISSPRLRQLFETVSPCFDWVIVDSPPVVPIADAVTLANQCDGVVLVVNSGSTPFDMAVKSCQDLRHRPLLGVVLNRITPKASSGQYYYEHYAAPQKTVR